ncbi:MAG: STAS domain-containing protein [Nitrospirae bacterium]|nr:STAS domain-containing protein [Nitrospirota bacterium]MDA1303730.1 STAS domain-containing protein [Nitrospirota bacterium]
MEISGYWEKNARVIMVSGAIDESEWMVLKAAFLAAQIAQRRHIVLNLTQMNSTEPWIIGKLFMAYLQLRQQGIRLSLVNPQPFIRKKLEPTNIPALVDYFSSEQEALKAA